MRIGWRGALGIALSVALLVWTLRGVSLPHVWQILHQSNLLMFVLSAATATICFPIRAWRWRYILHPVAPSLPYRPLWHSTAIGMMVNNLVPARAGELARAYALSRENVGVGFAAALGSLVVDRVFDALVILVFLLIVVSGPAFPAGIEIGGRSVEYWLRLGTIAALIPVVAMTALAFFPERMVKLWDAVAGRLAPRLVDRGRTLLVGFASGLGVLRDPVRFALVLFWSTVQWIVNGFSFVLAFAAVGITTSVASAFFLQSMLALSVSVPSAPGFFGVFEAVSKAALRVYGVDDTRAVSVAIGYHLLSFIPITVFGLWYFARLGIHFRDLRAAPATKA